MFLFFLQHSLHPPVFNVTFTPLTFDSNLKWTVDASHLLYVTFFPLTSIWMFDWPFGKDKLCVILLCGWILNGGFFVSMRAIEHFFVDGCHYHSNSNSNTRSNCNGSTKGWIEIDTSTMSFEIFHFLLSHRFDSIYQRLLICEIYTCIRYMDLDECHHSKSHIKLLIVNALVIFQILWSFRLSFFFFIPKKKKKAWSVAVALLCSIMNK